jgi:signal transduction histidine kinase
MGSHRLDPLVGAVSRTGYASVGLAGALGIFCLLTTFVVTWTTTGLVDGLTTLLPVPVAFLCGLSVPRVPGLVGVAWLAVTIELTQGYVNPFVIVLTLGPWLVGAVLRDHSRITQELADVGRQLETESQHLADEAVRLERARIARELHDIVAHCVSVMVVQAYAGERLIDADQTSAAEAFDHIADAASQARQEIAHLVDLLAEPPDAQPDLPLASSLGELVARTSATGLDIRLEVTGRPEQLPGVTARTAYRIVQESVTNALKHSPGAAIRVSVHCGGEVVIDVVNDARRSEGARLASSGAGVGLTSIRERVTRLGGTFAAGANGGESWRVSARFPAAVPP